MELTTYTSAAKTEGSALRRIILAFQQLGWRAVSYSDGEQRHKLETVAKASIANLLMDTEMSRLYWEKHEGETVHKGSMMFVFGNAPWEVMADASCGREPWDADMAKAEKAINLEGL